MTQGDTPSLNTVFRAQFYPLDYPGLAGQDLTPQNAIELNPLTPSLCEDASIYDLANSDLKIYPNPSQMGQSIRIEGGLNNFSTLAVYNLMGELVFQSEIGRE